MAAKKKAKPKPRTRTIPEEDWTLIHRFAVALEKGQFNDYIEILQSPRRLLLKSFISGVGKGFGAIVGATLVVAILIALLTGLANTDVLPDDVQNFFKSTKGTFEAPVK